MVDSDVDSWYDWRQGDDFNEMHRGRNANDVQLMGSDRYNHLTTDSNRKGSSQSNGLIRYSTTPTSSISGPEVRFINPAIYAETLNDEDEEHEVQIRVKVSSNDSGQIEGNCGDFTEVSDVMSTLSIKNDLATSYVNHAGDQVLAQETYRCYSLNSPTTPTSFESGIVRSKSVISCKPSSRVERRCKIAGRAETNDELCSARYALNGHQVVQISTTSLSSINISETRSNENEMVKKLTYSEWTRRKLEMARQRKEEQDLAERKKQMEAQRQAREKEEREKRERENFLKWTERKKKEEERKKAEVEKELELQKQLKDFVDNAAVAKTLHLRQWARKKKEEEKARQKKEEIKKKQDDEEKKKRLEESMKAYENWRKMAKNKPKPATQGLLPHQKAKPAYVNPTPWQGIVDDSEDVEVNPSNARKMQNQPKISSKRRCTSYQ
ncbi:uncharacterized protein LOC143183606 [Calliopsis andreniformis]|uniref:uncharacterized protein LOC143183606 n=1 Tax=Calliopsis andreniformis TaxID=337506 RepID=UPI003FCEDA0C